MYRLDGKPIVTQYDELWMTILSLVPIWIALKMNVDVEWLNYKDEIIHIDGNSDLQEITLRLNTIFAKKAQPYNGTPIIGRLRRLKRELANDLRDHLLLVFTDGAPTDGSDGMQETAIRELIDLYKKRQGTKEPTWKERTPLQSKRKLGLIMCTDKCSKYCSSILIKSLFSTLFCNCETC